MCKQWVRAFVPGVCMSRGSLMCMTCDYLLILGYQILIILVLLVIIIITLTGANNSK